jgi:small subunit ribosomal protein S15
LLSGSRSVATSSLHTSAILRVENQRKRQARATKKANFEKEKERESFAKANRPHIILGTRPGEDAKWRNSDLSKVLVDEEDLVASSKSELLTQLSGVIYLPKYIGFGVADEEKKMLFENLPALSAEAAALRAHTWGESPDSMLVSHSEAEKKELYKANAFARVIDLRNANAAGIAYENRRRIITEFSEPENPFDTGRPEVQGM